MSRRGSTEDDRPSRLARHAPQDPSIARWLDERPWLDRGPDAGPVQRRRPPGYQDMHDVARWLLDHR